MRPTLSVVLALLLAVLPTTMAGDTGGLTGRVLPSTDSRLVAKTVWIGAIPAVVDADGLFRANGIPTGSSQLAIETSEGLFVVATPVAIAPGSTRRVQLAFGVRQDSSAAPPAEKAVPKKDLSVWNNPLTASLIVVGSAIVVGFAIGELTQDDNAPVSPS